MVNDFYSEERSLDSRTDLCFFSGSSKLKGEILSRPEQPSQNWVKMTIDHLRRVLTLENIVCLTLPLFFGQLLNKISLGYF